MTDRLHRTICAVVSETRAQMMAKRAGWVPDPVARKIAGKLLVGVRKTFADNREIAAELDGFANNNVTAWVE
jgi:hypothetical protein